MRYKASRIICVFLIFMLVSAFSGQAVYADDYSERKEGIEDQIDGITDALDEEYKEVLDTEILKNGEYAKQGSVLVSTLVKMLLKTFMESVIQLCGAILLSAIAARVADISGGRISAQALRLIQTFFVTLICYSIVSSVFDSVQEYCLSLDKLISAYSVVLSEILLFGGNFTLSAVSAAILTFILEISRKLTLTVLVPIIKICFSVSIASTLTLSDNLKYICAFFKKLFVTLSVTFMTVLTVIMSFQTVIASASDTVALRSVKFAASNTVPIIGGLVSESLRTLSGAAGLFRGQAGIVGIICLLAVTLIPVARMLGVKYCFSFGQAFSSFIGGDLTGGILSDCSDLINYLIGTVVITTVYFSYFIFLFANLSGAVNG